LWNSLFLVAMLSLVFMIFLTGKISPGFGLLLMSASIVIMLSIIFKIAGYRFGPSLGFYEKESKIALREVVPSNKAGVFLWPDKKLPQHVIEWVNNWEKIGIVFVFDIMTTTEANKQLDCVIIADNGQAFIRKKDGKESSMLKLFPGFEKAIKASVTLRIPQFF